MNAQAAARQAEKQSTATKLARKADVGAAIRKIQVVVENDPAVTDAMLIGLGFPARRSGGSRPKTVGEVTGLSA